MDNQNQIDQLNQELRQLNQKLNSIDLNKSRLMVYNANPYKFALYNFIAGIFHSLGSLFGTAVIAAVIIYILSQIDFVQPITDWIEQIMSQIDWNSIMPTVTPQTFEIDPSLLEQFQGL